MGRKVGNEEEESRVIIITEDGSRMSVTRSLGHSDHRGFFPPLSVFPLFAVPFLQVALRHYFYLHLSSPRVAPPTPHPGPSPAIPSSATALSKSTRPPIHPGASQPPYRRREDIIIIACLLFPSLPLPLTPAIRPSRSVRQSLRLRVIAVEWLGVEGGGGLGRLRQPRAAAPSRGSVGLVVPPAFATVCEQRCHRISQGYLGC